MKNKFYLISLLICVLIGLIGIIFQWVWYLYIVALPIIFLGISDLSQTKHSLKYNFPSLSAVGENFFIEIEELYDTNNYLDSDPDVNISEYLSVDSIIEEYLSEDLTENQLIGILNSRFVPRVANNSLSKVYQAYLTSLTGFDDEGDQDSNNIDDEKTKLINYQINASEKYMGDTLYGLTAIKLKDLNLPDFLLTTDFLDGNNWFIWPRGSKIIDDTFYL